MNPKNIDKKIPYLNMRSIGIDSGLCLLSEIKTLLTNQEIQSVEIDETYSKKLKAIVSLSVLGPEPNYVGAMHCQKGQETVVRQLKYININAINESIGGKNIKRNVRKTKRNKRRTNKRRTNKYLNKKVFEF